MTAPPGDYFLTIIAGDLGRAVGPMQVTINEKSWLKELRVEQGEFVSKHTIDSPTDDVIQLKVEDTPRSLNGLILQPLRLANEDYFTRRKWWNHEVNWPGETHFPERQSSTHEKPRSKN